MHLRTVPVREDSPYRKAVEDLNAEAFCEQERSDFRAFMVGCRSGMADLLAFLDGEEFVGFAYVVLWKDMLYVYYLAVAGDKRSRGYGSLILDELKDRFGPKSVTLNMEYPDGSEEKERRLKFYVLNGFCETRRAEKWHGLDFELMYWGRCPGDAEMKEFFEAFEKARITVVPAFRDRIIYRTRSPSGTPRCSLCRGRTAP